MKHICISVDGRPCAVFPINKEGLSVTEQIHTIEPFIPMLTKNRTYGIKSFKKVSEYKYKFISLEGKEHPVELNEVPVELNEVYVWKETEIDELIEKLK